MTWPTGDACPECGRPMDVGAVGLPGETITWQQCDGCRIGWGPFTGFVDLDRDERLVTDGGEDSERLPWCTECDVIAVPTDRNECGRCGTRVGFR